MNAPYSDTPQAFRSVQLKLPPDASMTICCMPFLTLRWAITGLTLTTRIGVDAVAATVTIALTVTVAPPSLDPAWKTPEVSRGLLSAGSTLRVPAPPEDHVHATVAPSASVSLMKAVTGKSASVGTSWSIPGEMPRLNSDLNSTSTLAEPISMRAL